MSKIQIKCDMCGKFKDAKQTKQADTDECAIFIHNPYIVDHGHYICYDCLKKVGWKEKENETTSKEGEK